MIKIYYYELKRLFCRKSFWGLLLIVLIRSWQLLTGEIIRGISNTAPFSPWSFGFFLSQILPFLCASQLLLLASLTSRKTETDLADIAALDKRLYHAIRCGAVLSGTVLITIASLLTAAVFYIRFFHFSDFASFAFPAALSLLPCILFCLGAGRVLIKLHPALLFLLALSPLPLDFTGANFFASYPIELNVLDPAFSVPLLFLASRGLYLVLGVFLLFAVLLKKKKQVS